MITFTQKYRLENILCSRTSDGAVFRVRGYFDQETNTFVSYGPCTWGIKFKEPKQFKTGELVLIIVFNQTYSYEIQPDGSILEILFKEGDVFIHTRKASFLERCFSKRLKTPFKGSEFMLILEPPQYENEGDPITGTFIEHGDLFFIQDEDIHFAVFLKG